MRIATVGRSLRGWFPHATPSARDFGFDLPNLPRCVPFAGDLGGSGGAGRPTAKLKTGSVDWNGAAPEPLMCC